MEREDGGGLDGWGGVEAVGVGGKVERTEWRLVGEGGEEGGGDTCLNCVPPVSSSSSHQCGPASVRGKGEGENLCGRGPVPGCGSGDHFYPGAWLVKTP